MLHEMLHPPGSYCNRCCAHLDHVAPGVAAPHNVLLDVQGRVEYHQRGATHTRQSNLMMSHIHEPCESHGLGGLTSLEAMLDLHVIMFIHTSSCTHGGLGLAFNN